MRARKKSTRNRKDHPTGGGFYWLLAVLALGAMGWIWWRVAHIPPQTGRKFKSEPSAVKEEARKSNNQTNRVLLAPKLTGTNAEVEVKKETPIAKSTDYSSNEHGGHTVKSLLEAQVVLTRMGISCGSVDGVLGSQTKAALRVYQSRNNLPVTGLLDATTRNNLFLTEEPFKHWIVTREMLSRLTVVPHTWLGKSEAERLDYETVLEMAAERGHAHPDLIRKLNPTIQWDKIIPGQSILIPNLDYTNPPPQAAYIKILLGQKTLSAFGDRSNLLAHFPCSIAKKAEKRPVGELHVITIVRNPNYVFNPAVFPESDEGRRIGRKLILPPGPNNPVGIAWIGLDKPGFGMHGTPRPEDVGRTESHGCFRLANWNAEYLAGMVSIGTPVFIEP